MKVRYSQSAHQPSDQALSVAVDGMRAGTMTSIGHAVGVSDQDKIVSKINQSKVESNDVREKLRALASMICAPPLSIYELYL